jgi:hypothetical protein
VDSLIADYLAFGATFPLGVHWFDEIPDKGKLQHMTLLMEMDVFRPEMDAFFNIDSDNVFTGPVDVSEYYRDGKLRIGVALFSETGRVLPPVLNWQKAAERALGWKSEQDMMVWFPIAHIPETLRKTRELIESHTGRPWRDYILEQQNCFPEGFAEYNTLGPVAWRFYHNRYHWDYYWLDLPEGATSEPPGRLYKGWAYKGLSEEELALFKRSGLDR